MRSSRPVVIEYPQHKTMAPTAPTQTKSPGTATAVVKAEWTHQMDISRSRFAHQQVIGTNLELWVVPMCAVSSVSIE